jgi:hypothetical protein
VCSSVLCCLLLIGRLKAQQLYPENHELRITQLIAALHQQPWQGAINGCTPTCWFFHFTDPMKGLLKIGAPAQKQILENLFDPDIADQIVILLGGVGDEQAVEPIIQVMKRVQDEPPTDRRRRTLTAGKLALTNITVADTNWHHGGGITIDACPNDPGGCWSSWWQKNKGSFRVRDIKTSRHYSNYPNYGIYRGLD